MKKVHIFFLFILCISCTDYTTKEVEKLNQEFTEVPITSTSFDSLLSVMQKLPLKKQIKCIIQISKKDETQKDGILKQEKLLLDILPLVSKKSRKNILLQLIILYNKLDIRGINTYPKANNCIKELETYYSLNKEEEWKVKQIKALFLNKRGKQEEYLPIWFELLKEHRIANKPIYIIDDLLTIAKHFNMLGDYKEAISKYEEAYQLAVNNQLYNVQNECIPPLIKLLCDVGEYSKALNYYNKIINSKQDLIIPPSIQNTPATCYLNLHKPDSARIYLSKQLEAKNKDGFFLYSKMAETYIIENKEDSAAYFLKKAIDTHTNSSKVILPNYSLTTFSLFAELLQRNGKHQQANQYFIMIEPQMKESCQGPIQLKRQIEALTSFSTFCRSTKQYEKALELLAHRDSIQHIYNEIQQKRDSKNLADRLEIQELQSSMNMKDKELEYSSRLNIIIGTFVLILFALLPTAWYLIKLRTKYKSAVKRQEEASQNIENTNDVPDIIEKKPIENIQTDDNTKKKPTNKDFLLFSAIQEFILSGDRFLNTDLSIETITKELKSNHQYISRAINLCAESDLTGWLNSLRIDHAVELMQKNPTANLRQLSTKCGFKSYGTFSRNFKRFKNVTPYEYITSIPANRKDLSQSTKQRNDSTK